jgi:hypothetical protein
MNWIEVRMSLGNPYILFPLLAVLTWISAVIWNRWYMRRLFVKEFRKQLRIELREQDTMTVLKLDWRRK